MHLCLIIYLKKDHRYYFKKEFTAIVFNYFNIVNIPEKEIRK